MLLVAGSRNRHTVKNVTVTATVPMYFNATAQAGMAPKSSERSRMRAVKAQKTLESTVK